MTDTNNAESLYSNSGQIIERNAGLLVPQNVLFIPTGITMKSAFDMLSLRANYYSELAANCGVSLYTPSPSPLRPNLALPYGAMSFPEEWEKYLLEQSKRVRVQLVFALIPDNAECLNLLRRFSSPSNQDAAGLIHRTMIYAYALQNDIDTTQISKISIVPGSTNFAMANSDNTTEGFISTAEFPRANRTTSEKSVG